MPITMVPKGQGRYHKIPGGAKKRPEYLHALFTRAIEMNQCKSIYVMTKHLRICVGIFT